MKQSAAALFLALSAISPLPYDRPVNRSQKRKEDQKQKMLEEYELIKQKKSKLSANQRRRIVEYVETRLSR